MSYQRNGFLASELKRSRVSSLLSQRQSFAPCCADIVQSLTAAAGANGFAQPYLLGDANLDGMVDAQDLNAVGQNWLASIPPIVSPASVPNRPGERFLSSVH